MASTVSLVAICDIRFFSFFCKHKHLRNKNIKYSLPFQVFSFLSCPVLKKVCLNFKILVSYHLLKLKFLLLQQNNSKISFVNRWHFRQYLLTNESAMTRKFSSLQLSFETFSEFAESWPILLRRQNTSRYFHLKPHLQNCIGNSLFQVMVQKFCSLPNH